MGKVNVLNMDEMVITPGGLRPRSSVHVLEEGVHVISQQGILKKVNSSTNMVVEELGEAKSIQPEYYVNRNILRRSVREIIPDTSLAPQPSPITDRWIVYSGWENLTGAPITYFSTTWIVPPAPTTDNGQLIYLFNGIENSNFDAILQPVLQWGNSPAGGGSFWSISNWYVGAPGSNICYCKPVVPVEEGQVLQGIMRLVGQTGERFNYISSFLGFPTCDLFVPSVKELVWANETLECWNFKQFSDYPNTLLTAMTDIEILVGVNQAPIVWTSHNDVTDNGQHCSIISNNSPGGSINLFYRQDIE